MKLKLNERVGPFNRELFKRVFIKKNSGNYGEIPSLPTSSDAIAVHADTSINIEFKDEQSNAQTNGRDKFQDIRLKGEAKLKLSTFLSRSGSALVEWSIGKLLDLVLGRSEAVASARGASIAIKDPSNTLAGLTITTEGALLGMPGNYATIKLVNGGSSGSVALSDTSSPAFTLTYYNDSTVEDVVTALAANNKLTAVADANGDDATDLFIDLLSARSLSSGKTLYLSGGCAAGYIYDNSIAPSKDSILVLARELIGYVVSGVVLDKISFDFSGESIPKVSAEGSAKRARGQGMAKLTIAASNSNKIYVGADYNRFSFDSGADCYLDVVDNDGESYKSIGNKITGHGTDVTGSYVQVQNAVTADVGDYVKFYEPISNPVFDPINGMTGKLKIDNRQMAQIRNVKFEYANNHQMLNNLAFTDTNGGFVPAKWTTGKFSCEVLFKNSDMDLYNKLTEKSVHVIPVEIQVGEVAGETFTIFMRNVSFKVPDLSDKADEASTFSLEGEAVAVPDSVNVIPSVMMTTT